MFQPLCRRGLSDPNSISDALYGRGYVVSLFALVWVSNQYMSIYSRLRLDIKHENLEIKAQEGDVERRKTA